MGGMYMYSTSHLGDGISSGLQETHLRLHLMDHSSRGLSDGASSCSPGLSLLCISCKPSSNYNVATLQSPFMPQTER